MLRKLTGQAVIKTTYSRLDHAMRLTLLSLLLVFGLQGFAQDLQENPPQNFSAQAGQSLDGFSQPEFLPVEEAYQLALEVVDNQTLRLYWQITDGYYLYRKRLSFSLVDEAGAIELSPQLPTGITREDEYFGISEVYYQQLDVFLELARAGGRATLEVGSQGCADAGLCYPPQKQRFSIDFEQGTIGATAGKPSTRPAPATTEAAAPFSLAALLSMMLLAFVGGSILNLMPCVFPVLSLKVFSFASGTEHSKHVHGWVYAAGVVSSFLLIAFILITLQQAGSAVGWGFQLQSPRFVALLAYLFFAMGLGLSGLVEIGAGLMGTGSQLASRRGYSGSFFTGVLATVVASPCTAPFMGTALGFAVTQPAPVALAVFAALGAGMAAPMLLLSYSSALRSRMPRPGPWMETFKQVLAFPLYATAIWLLWVAGRQTSVSTMAILLAGMLALTLGLWLWRYRGWGKAVAIAALALALLVIPSPALDSKPTVTATTQGTPQQQVDALLAAGKPVFVNVTADWCITCIANERASLGTDVVKQAMAERGITYLVIDWTNYDADIAHFLAQFGRNGVPLYLVYNGQPGQPPLVLSQLLTPGMILDAFADIPRI
jgi:thiol:disulfide interchange protein